MHSTIEIPPPLAFPELFQTTSPWLVAVVPPTPITSGWLAGSSTARVDASWPVP